VATVDHLHLLVLVIAAQDQTEAAWLDLVLGTLLAPLGSARRQQARLFPSLQTGNSCFCEEEEEEEEEEGLDEARPAEYGESGRTYLLLTVWGIRCIFAWMWLKARLALASEPLDL